MALTVSTGGGGRVTSVGVATPGRITGVGVAQPGVISGVVNATPGRITGVYNADQYPGPVISPAATRPPGSVYGGGGGGAPAQVYAPALDLNAIRAGARSAAESAVNPLYTQQLTTFLAREAAKRARAQQDNELAVKSLDEALAQSQEVSQLGRERTTEDVATNIGDINATADQAQNIQGQQFEDERIAEARALATGGLVGSGIGNQTQNRTLINRNTAEATQAQDVQRKKAAQELLKARSFEDLAKSDTLNIYKTKKGKEAAKIDLDRMIEDIAYEESSTRQTLEKQRYSDLAAEQARQAKIAVQNFIAGIRDPAQRQAAYAAYGNAF